MRRALMKKMKKGSLTPGERRDLMELDREVNRANRQAAGIGGAGLATALAIASKTGALGRGKDALGEFLDERAGIREERKGQKPIEKEEKREAKERAEDEADLSRRASAAARSEEAEIQEKEQLENERLDNKLKKRGGFDPRTGEYVDSDEQKAEDERFEKEFDEFIDKEEAEEELAYRVYELRESGMSDRDIFEKLKKEGNLPGSITGDSYAGEGADDPFAASDPMVMMRRIRKNERIDKRDKKKEEKESNRIQKQIDFVNKYGGFNPLTGEYIDSPEQIAADKKFDRDFDEFFSDADALEVARLYNESSPSGRAAAGRLAAQVLTPEQQQVERFRNRSAVQALRGGRESRDRTLPIDLLPFDSPTSDYTGGFETTGERPEFSSSSLRRSDGPRVDNADGGNTPFLRQMRDRIRKKFR